jgi:ParB-like chromosome segregation protein Spo0J
MIMGKSKGNQKRSKATDQAESNSTRVVWIELDKISIDSQWSKSQRSVLEEAEVLASVKAYGILEELPLRVVPDPRQEGAYILVDGKTRHKGARLRGDKVAPCIVYPVSLEEGRRLAFKLNGWAQEAVKKATFAHILVEALEDARVRHLPKIPKLLTVSIKDKERIASRAKVSITTVDRGLVALRKLYSEFIKTDPQLVQISVIDCFWQSIRREPDSNLSLFYRDRISLNAFLTQLNQEHLPLQEQHRGLTRRRNKHRPINIQPAADLTSKDNEASEAKASKQILFSEGVTFGEILVSLVELVESGLVNGKGSTTTAVIEKLNDIIKAFPEKVLSLCEISRIIQWLDKKKKLARAKQEHKGATLERETLLF